MKKFFSSEREVKSYSPLDSQISSADFSLVINFPHKIFVPSKPATLQLSKMVWHLKIGQKLRVLGAKTWGVMFFQNFWLKLKGAILGPQNHFWWFQRQNGGFPNGYFGFLKKKLKSESAILRLPNFCSCTGGKILMTSLDVVCVLLEGCWRLMGWCGVHQLFTFYVLFFCQYSKVWQKYNVYKIW